MLLKGTSKKHHPLTYLQEDGLSLGNLPSVTASMLSSAHEERASKSKSHWPEPCVGSLGRLSEVRGVCPSFLSHSLLSPSPPARLYQRMEKTGLHGLKEGSHRCGRQPVLENNRPTASQLHTRYLKSPKFFKTLS